MIFCFHCLDKVYFLIRVSYAFFISFYVELGLQMKDTEALMKNQLPVEP